MAKEWITMAKSRVWVSFALAMVLALGAVLSGGLPVRAQDTTNLLVNGGLENPYYGQGAPTRTAPNGWSLWVGAGAPEAFPHTDKVQVLDGEVSWNIKQGYAVFTAAGYQRVSGLTPGEAVKLTAYGWVYTCNDTTTSCIIPDYPYRRSDPSAGASLKVGIDPTGGTDPLSANVVWSGSAAPYDQWAELTVTAQAQGDSVTVFLYATQSAGLALNNVYWDKVSLVRTTGGTAAGPAPAEVPFVTPQGVRPDGSIIHVVQSGDTLSSIAYAYFEYGVTIESIAALNNLKPNTRFLQIGQELVILPPGSVDPVTGKVVAGGGAAVAAQPTLVPTPVPTPTPVEGAGETTPPQPPVAETTPAEPPVTYGPVEAEFVPLERGAMFWLQDTNQIFVLTYGMDDLSGTYKAYQNTWMEGMPEIDPNLEAQVPAGFSQPTRRFGQAWRTYAGVKDALGWAIDRTTPYTALVVRQGGIIVFNGPEGRVYQFDAEGNWQAYSLNTAQQTAG